MWTCNVLSWDLNVLHVVCYVKNCFLYLLKKNFMVQNWSVFANITQGCCVYFKTLSYTACVYVENLTFMVHHSCVYVLISTVHTHKLSTLNVNTLAIGSTFCCDDSYWNHRNKKCNNQSVKVALFAFSTVIHIIQVRLLSSFCFVEMTYIIDG